jgi:hypothetical protein
MKDTSSPQIPTRHPTPVRAPLPHFLRVAQAEPADYSAYRSRAQRLQLTSDRPPRRRPSA